MTPRVRTLAPWAVVTTVIAALLCAVAWPGATGWAVGGAVGTVALVAGVRMLLEEQREKAAPRSSTCAGCVGCGGPDCVQHSAGCFDSCPTPETHNWGCGCPTGQAPTDQIGQQ